MLKISFVEIFWVAWLTKCAVDLSRVISYVMKSLEKKITVPGVANRITLSLSVCFLFVFWWELAPLRMPFPPIEKHCNFHVLFLQLEDIYCVSWKHLNQLTRYFACAGRLDLAGQVQLKASVCFVFFSIESM